MKKSQILFLTGAFTFILSCGEENKNQPVQPKEERLSSSFQPTKTKEISTPAKGEWHSDITHFIPAGYTILHQEEGDLNEDGVQDLIVVLNHNEEAQAIKKGIEAEDRQLLILTGNKDRMYQLEAKNNKTVLCYDCGGAMGDPFQGITIKNGYFSVEHMGGAGMRWTRIVTYKYNKTENEWYLYKDGGDYFHSSEPDKIESSYIKTTKDFGKVKFEKFDIFKD